MKNSYYISFDLNVKNKPQLIHLIKSKPIKGKPMLGLPKGEVFLLDSTEKWILEYENESELIRNIIGEYVNSIHHIGSTAIPKLKAKPIIDIAIEIKAFDLGFKCIDPLSKLGYQHRIIEQLPDRHYFSKGEPRPIKSICLQKTAYI